MGDSATTAKADQAPLRYALQAVELQLDIIQDLVVHHDQAVVIEKNVFKGDSDTKEHTAAVQRNSRDRPSNMNFPKKYEEHFLMLRQ